MEQNKIITKARNFLKERIDSLKNDCHHCLFEEHPAPFPALLYCFATVDLLGSLYKGNATSSSSTTKQSLEYMTGIMKYPKKQVDLLQKVFRHKLVHLAQPNPKTKYEDKKYSWWFCHESNRAVHLKIETLEQKSEYVFRFSLWNFVEDIEDSVFGPNGYMEQLTKNTGNLQESFNKAYKEINEEK